MPSSEVMKKYKAGTLRSGGNGSPVTSRKQAIAIMLSEKRNEAAHGGEYVSGSDRKNPLAGTRHKRK